FDSATDRVYVAALCALGDTLGTPGVRESGHCSDGKTRVTGDTRHPHTNVSDDRLLRRRQERTAT
ncbi:MAG: hypothetical protein V3T24_07520, partial [Longimicrobiales bacterium]